MTGNTQNTGTTHNTLFNKIGDYAKTNFVINWASGTVIFGAICFSVIMYYKNQNLQKTIDGNNKTIKTLSSTVKTLETTVTAMNTTVEAFKANPPAVTDEKINGIYKMMDIYHGNNTTNHNPPAFTSTQPSGNTPNGN
jgi:hypothetical protein